MRENGSGTLGISNRGVNTNIDFLMNVVDHADFKEGVIHTRWVDLNMAPLAEPSEARQRYVSMQPATAEGGFAGRKGGYIRSPGVIRPRC